MALAALEDRGRNMVGKNTLNQYTDIQQEIKELEHRIQRLRNKRNDRLTDTAVGSSPEFPYNERIYTISGFNLEDSNEKLDRLEQLLKKRIQKCEDMKEEIEKFIDNIEDSRTRRVFTLRYIEGLTWLQIARRIERYDESYPRKIIHDKYLNKVR